MKEVILNDAKDSNLVSYGKDIYGRDILVTTRHPRQLKVKRNNNGYYLSLSTAHVYGKGQRIYATKEQLRQFASDLVDLLLEEE